MTFSIYVTRHSGRDCWNPDHKDVNLLIGNSEQSNTYETGTLPSLALDSGIHAGMTVTLVIMRIAENAFYPVVNRLVYGTIKNYNCLD